MEAVASVSSVDYANANGELLELYDEIKRTCCLDILPNWVTYLGHNKELLEGIWRFYCGVVVKGTLPPLLQELIIFSVSYKNRSQYCSEFHASNILNMKPSLSYEQLLDVIADDPRGYVPERYRYAITIATQHSFSDCALPDKDKETLSNSGYSMQDITEICGLSSLALALNTLTKALAIPIDPSHKVRNFRI